nr:uncharacterized protein LOC111518269 [Leptinotarsa decemlineata]
MPVSKVYLQKINVNIQEVEVLEQRVLSSLPINEAYVIRNMTLFSTRFGKSILLTLEDVRNNNKLFKTWLPKQISMQFSDDDITCINSSSDMDFSDFEVNAAIDNIMPDLKEGAMTASIESELSDPSYEDVMSVLGEGIIPDMLSQIRNDENPAPTTGSKKVVASTQEVEACTSSANPSTSLATPSTPAAAAPINNTPATTVLIEGVDSSEEENALVEHIVLSLRKKYDAAKLACQQSETAREDNQHRQEEIVRQRAELAWKDAELARESKFLAESDRLEAERHKKRYARFKRIKGRMSKLLLHLGNLFDEL